MAQIIQFPFHALTSHEGRGTSDGQSQAGGQFSENHFIARSSRRTCMSAPDPIAANFLPSLNARELTVDSSTPSSSAYFRATVRSWSIPVMSEISVNLPEMSTAILPDAPVIEPGHSTGMDTSVVLANILARLKELGMSPDEASRLAGKPDSIRNLKRKVKAGKKGGMGIQTLAALAETLKTTPQALMAAPERAAPKIAHADAPRLREFLVSQREMIDRQIEALDADEKRQKRRRARNR